MPSEVTPYFEIKPRKTWRLFDFKEFAKYKDLLYFFVYRDITVLYKQTVLGLLWAVLNPVVSMVIFSVIFGDRQ